LKPLNERARVIVETRAQLLARRDKIYADLKRTPEEFARLFEQSSLTGAILTLTGAEWDACDELDEIEFLLDEDCGHKHTQQILEDEWRCLDCGKDSP
jgi:hypothetical protein